MCGIAGKFFFDPARPVEPQLLHRMNAVLAHRGPDDSGVFHEGSIGLAHRRLSIIDLSPAGHQPMSNRDKSLWITFNGEIYNFLELRADLERSGAVFQSKTDTEVILALYERHGVDCLTYLRGMFAFAIWDARHRQLFVARDRLGKKPLTYYADSERFVFGSEPKAILQDPEVPVEADTSVIDQYLSYGYVPSPHSAFKHFRTLPPAHYLMAREGHVDVHRYWQLDFEPKHRATEDELCEALIDELKEAVRLRLISDVPLGAFLSGGIDSSAIVALMSEVSSSPVKTFSIGFEEQAYNELPYARLVADQYKTDHHEFIVKPDAVEVLPALVWHYNQPYADSSAVPTYYLARLARQHVTVALNGDAGDENFAGYDRYLASEAAMRYDRLPRAVRRTVALGTAALPEMGSARSLYRRGRRFLAGAVEEPSRRYAKWIEFFPASWKAQMYTPAFLETAAEADALGVLMRAHEAVRARESVDRTLAVDVQTYLPDDLLVKVDIASMAHALEARSPMVDHKFMEFVAKIPATLKLKGRAQKYIFKKALESRLPAEIINRPKRGFGVPLDQWFRHDLRDMARDVLLGRRAIERGLFRREFVEGMLDDHWAGGRHRHNQLWALLMLELWFQRFIDQPPLAQAVGWNAHA